MIIKSNTTTSSYYLKSVEFILKMIISYSKEIQCLLVVIEFVTNLWKICAIGVSKIRHMSWYDDVDIHAFYYYFSIEINVIDLSKT